MRMRRLGWASETLQSLLGKEHPLTADALLDRARDLLVSWYDGVPVAFEEPFPFNRFDPDVYNEHKQRDGWMQYASGHVLDLSSQPFFVARGVRRGKRGDYARSDLLFTPVENVEAPTLRRELLSRPELVYHWGLRESGTVAFVHRRGVVRFPQDERGRALEEAAGLSDWYCAAPMWMRSGSGLRRLRGVFQYYEPDAVRLAEGVREGAFMRTRS